MFCCICYRNTICLIKCLRHPLYDGTMHTAGQFRVTGLCGGNPPVTAGSNVLHYSNSVSSMTIYCRCSISCLVIQNQLNMHASPVAIGIPLTLQWRHNERDGVSNHQPHDCLLNYLFSCRSKKTSKPASLAFVRGIHRWPVNSPHKGPVTQHCFHLMTSLWILITKQIILT